jgi:PAS domain S-box-containing protein
MKHPKVSAEFLLDALASVGEGVMLFDKDERLLLANRRYYELYPELADIAVPGAPLDAILQGAAKRGLADETTDPNEDWVAWRKRMFRTPGQSAEHRRPDGGWTLVNQRRIAGGGTVVICTDITALKQQEAERRAQLDFFALAVEGTDVGITYVDQDLNFRAFNRRAAEILDLPPELMQLPRPMADFFRFNAQRGEYGPGDVEEQVASRLALVRRFEAHEFERTRPNGAVVRIHGRPLPNGGFVTTYTDITVLRRRESELNAHQRISEAALQGMDQGMIVVDADLRIVAFNRRFVDLFEFPEDFVHVGLSAIDLFRFNAQRGMYGPGDVEAHVASRVASTKRPQPVRYERALPDGKVIEARGMPLPDGGFVTTYTDVTEVRRQAVAFQQAKEAAEDNAKQLVNTLGRFDAALENMTQGLILYDAEERVLVWNRRYAEIFSFPPDFLKPGLTVRELVTYHILFGNYHDSDAERVFKLRMQHAASRARGVFFEHLTSGRTVEVIHQPMPDGGAVATYTDITEQEKAQQALQASEESLRERVAELESTRSQMEAQQQTLTAMTIELSHARDEAEGANRAKSAFLANMSHELRTPLNAIIGFSELMMNETFGPIGNARYADYLNDVHQSGRHLLEIINDILDLSKVEAGKVALREEPVVLSKVIDDCQRLIGERVRAGNLKTRIDIAPNLPAIRADDVRMKQVLINLMANAVKFTPAGGTVTVAAMAAPDGGVMIKVSDTGIGMRAEDIPIALQPFGQIDSSLSRKHEGTGLGLPLVKALIELHDGKLSIESSPGKGTTVTITLPRSRVLSDIAASAQTA